MQVRERMQSLLAEMKWSESPTQGHMNLTSHLEKVGAKDLMRKARTQKANNPIPMNRAAAAAQKAKLGDTVRQARVLSRHAERSKHISQDGSI